MSAETLQSRVNRPAQLIIPIGRSRGAPLIEHEGLRLTNTTVIHFYQIATCTTPIPILLLSSAWLPRNTLNLVRVSQQCPQLHCTNLLPLYTTRFFHHSITIIIPYHQGIAIFIPYHHSVTIIPYHVPFHHTIIIIPHIIPLPCHTAPYTTITHTVIQHYPHIVPPYTPYQHHTHIIPVRLRRRSNSRLRIPVVDSP